MKSLTRKEILIKFFCFFISIFSIILIKNNIQGILSEVASIKSMGGFAICPITSKETTIQSWYYYIITYILLCLSSVIILTSSIYSLFFKIIHNEIYILIQTLLFIIFHSSADENFYIILEIIDYYPLITIALIIVFITTIIMLINKKTILFFYILQLIILIIKYMGIIRMWLPIKNDIQLLEWLMAYGFIYIIVFILGMFLLILKNKN